MHARLDHAINLLTELLAETRQLREEIRMATIQLKRLTDAVAAEKTVEQSILKFIAGVPDLIRQAIANATDMTSAQAALDDLAAQIEVNNTELAAAVTANTPAAPPVEPPAAPAPAPAPAPAATTTPPTDPTTPPAT